MSDFDKEAEREKLRKKFARDEEKRASTQRMSELLLKGATMTNKHCNQCSDPLFRYNGQTFCPSCQADGAAAQRQSESPSDETEATKNRDANSESVSGQHAGTQPVDDQPAGEQTVRESTAAKSTPTAPPTDQSVGGVDSAVSPASSSPEAASQPHTADQQFTNQSTDGSLTEARQSLRRTVTRFARTAEQTEDPRQARELLAAAREAAATLAALE